MIRNVHNCPISSVTEASPTSGFCRGAHRLPTIGSFPELTRSPIAIPGIMPDKGLTSQSEIHPGCLQTLLQSYISTGKFMHDQTLLPMRIFDVKFVFIISMLIETFSIILSDNKLLCL